ncbi:MAG: aminotransferase, partial [Actinomycetota bacterium]
DDDTFDYLVDAVATVADHAVGLLPHYRFDPDRGLWTCRAGVVTPPSSLHDITYASGTMEAPSRPQRLPDGGLPAYLERAHRLMHELATTPPEPAGTPTTNADFEHLRWFRYPDEALEPSI